MKTWVSPYEEEDSDDKFTHLINPNGIEFNELSKYCHHLKACYPVTLGFYPGLGKTECCWCPCDKALGGWRQTYKVPLPYRDGNPSPCSNGRITSAALLQHPETKGKHCIYHRATLNYVHKLMCKHDGEYLGLKGGHFSLHPKNSVGYQQAFDNEM